MKKPSIFSSDYNKRMKKRKIILSISIISILVVSVISVGLVKININFEDIRNGIQAWIDSDNTVKPDNTEIQNPQTEEKVETQKPEEPEAKFLELSISDGKTAKVEYEEVDGEKKMKNVGSIPENIYYSISPSKKYILFIDELQNIKVYNTNGKMKDLTNQSYTSREGKKFTKEWALGSDKNYLWHSDAKFIDDNKIAYVSCVPYFGSNLDKYVWLVDQNNAHTTLWNLKGKNVVLGEVTDKGLEVTVDGNIKHIDSSGNITN